MKVNSPLTPKQISTTFIKQFLLFCYIIIGSSQLCITQSTQDSLQNALETANGKDRVDILNQISNGYEHYNNDSLYFYAAQAEALAVKIKYRTGNAWAVLNKAKYFGYTGNYLHAKEEYDIAIALFSQVNEKDGLIVAYYNKGKVHRMSGDYDQALSDFLESLKISEEVGDQKGIAYAYLNIGIIYSTRLGESSEKGLPYFINALEISREINDQKCVSYALNNIALVYLDLEEYDNALDYHHQSLKLKQAAGDKAGIGSSLGGIGDIYTLKDDYETAIKYNQQALDIYREINDHLGIMYGLLEIGKAYTYLEKYNEAIPYLNEALSNLEDVNSLQLISGTYQYLYEYHLAIKDFEKALEYHQKYNMVEDSIYSENSSQQIADMRTLYETEKKEAEISQLTSEKTIHELQIRKSEYLKVFFIIALILMVLIAGFAYYGYRQKQKANRFLVQRNRFEIENKKRAISLFGQQVSKEVAQELLSNSFKSGSNKLFACIMFLDIRDFTPFVEDKEPAEIIQYQNDVFGFMIDTISKHHGIINQFMGDGFMATFGAPASSGNDCQNAVNASLEIIDKLHIKSKSGELAKTRIGIGLHAGNIVTGNVGTAQRKQYSITGNTVILASRIEQLNKTYKSEVLISKEVFENLDQTNLKTKSLGTVSLKGRHEPIEIVQLI
jgi:adenylate cyclase